MTPTSPRFPTVAGSRLGRAARRLPVRGAAGVASVLLFGFAPWVSASSAQPPIEFSEVAAASGIRFVGMHGGERAKRFILETTGTGAAWLDYDADGDLDLFLPNGSRLGYGPDQSLSSALFRNDGAGGFSDVTGPAGLEAYGWAQGAAVADHENDGDPDLFVTYYGANRFFRNRGDGTFEEAAAEVGLDDRQWGAGAAFGDFDRDGRNDLAVVNYVDFDPDRTPGPGGAPNCFFLGMPVMCGPKGLGPAPALLYRARADGGFEPVSGTDVGAARHYGLGVAWGDLDDDGDLDLYVANDQTPNNLFRNDTDASGPRFTDVGLSAGVAYNEDGRAQAGMGVALGDYDNDGALDIYVTNFSHDYNTLYRSAGAGWFLDESFSAGVAEAAWPHLGWGTGFADFDLDGWLDILVVNGHVYPEVEGPVTDSEYAQPVLLFRSLGDGAFVETASGPLLDRRPYRGAAFADYDNDGDPDVLATVMNGSPALFRNEAAAGGARWAGFSLVGRRSVRDGLGARVRIETGAGGVRVREAATGGSYLSAGDPRVLFGLGDAPGPIRGEVRWLSGCRQEIEIESGRYLVVVEPRDCGSEGR